MPVRSIAKFEIKYLQILDEKGKLDKKFMPKVSNETLIDWYEDMVLARKFSDKMLALQRSGRMGTFAPVNGQEAAQVGSCAAIKDDDWMVPAFREIGAYIHRGEDMVAMLLYNMGSEEGNMPPEDNKFNNFTPAVPVGSQWLHAAGLAWAAKIKGEKRVAIVYGGDGATSQGDFYEAMNFAGVYGLPIVFLVQNNQWAISVPRKNQTHAETIAQKGIAAGIGCMQVDGNDILAVYKATSEAAAKARKGEPQVLELVTYRKSMHTTADDPRVYRTEKEEKEWAKKDPIDRFRKFLEKKKLWDKKKEVALQEELDNHINDRIKEAQEHFNKDPQEMFKYMFEKQPSYLKEQMEQFAAAPSKVETDEATEEVIKQHQEEAK